MDHNDLSLLYNNDLNSLYYEKINKFFGIIPYTPKIYIYLINYDDTVGDIVGGIFLKDNKEYIVYGDEQVLYDYGKCLYTDHSRQDMLLNIFDDMKNDDSLCKCIYKKDKVENNDDNMDDNIEQDMVVQTSVCFRINQVQDVIKTCEQKTLITSYNSDSVDKNTLITSDSVERDKTPTESLFFENINNQDE